MLAFPLVAAFVALAAPRLGAGQFRALPVLAANHLVTLGWGTMIALGALHQLLPAAAGVRHDPGRIVIGQFVLHLTGVVLLAIGFWWRAALILITGGSAILASVLISAITAVSVLRRRTRWNEPLTYIVGALASLALVVGWGLTLALNWRFAFWRALLTRMGLTVHLAFGLVGWFAILIVGVSYYLLPRFATRRHLDGTQVRAVFILLVVAVVALVLGALLVPVLVRVGLLAAGAAGIVYSLDVRGFLRAWSRRAPDVTRVHWQIIVVETAVLSLGMIASALGLLTPGPWGAAGVTLFLTGWVTLAITGQAYKVTPFLMWYYRFAQGLSALEVPRLDAPYWPRSVLPSLILLGGAGPLMALGILLGWPVLGLIGGLAFFAGSCVFAYVLGYSWIPRLWQVRAGRVR